MKYVYAIRFGKYVKIGCSTDPAHRLRALPGKLRKPVDLDLADREPLCAFPGEFESERFFHMFFSDFRHEGEFFSLPDDQVELLRRCNTDDQRAELFRQAETPLDDVAEVDEDF